MGGGGGEQERDSSLATREDFGGQRDLAATCEGKGVREYLGPWGACVTVTRKEIGSAAQAGKRKGTARRRRGHVPRPGSPSGRLGWANRFCVRGWVEVEIAFGRGEESER